MPPSPNNFSKATGRVDQQGEAVYLEGRSGHTLTVITALRQQLREGRLCSGVRQPDRQATATTTSTSTGGSSTSSPTATPRSGTAGSGAAQSAEARVQRVHRVVALKEEDPSAGQHVAHLHLPRSPTTRWLASSVWKRNCASKNVQLAAIGAMRTRFLE